MKPWEEYSQTGQAAGPWQEYQSGTPSTPMNIGREAFADTLREELAGTDWLTRNIAGAGSAAVQAWEGLKGLAGRTDPRQVEEQRIIAESAPIGNIAGNVALLAPTMAIPGAATIPGAAIVGGVTGAALTPGDIAERAKAAGIGVLGGAAGAGISRAIGTRTPPRADPNVEALRAEGVQLTPGQGIGGLLKTLEDKATSVPIVGDIINAARRRGVEDFNRAAIGRASLPGQPVQEIGREGVANVRQQLGQAYDDVLSRSSANALDPQFVQNVASLRSMVASLPEKEQRAFDSFIAREIEQRMAPGGQINAENLQGIKSALGQGVSDFGTSTDAYQRQLGQAMRQLQAEFQDLISRANPRNADDLRAIDTAYANFKRIQRAASGVGAEDGIFTPAQLKNAAKAMDRSKDKRAFSEGTAVLQDLAEAGQAVLPSKVPDSGTAGRLMGNLFSLSGLASTAAGAAGALPALVAYSPTGSRAIQAAVNQGILPLSYLLRRGVANPATTGLAGVAGAQSYNTR